MSDGGRASLWRALVRSVRPPWAEVGVIVASGALIGAVCNELNPQNRVPYFGFSKQDVLESRLAASVERVHSQGPVLPGGKPMAIVFFFAECEGCKIVREKVLPEIRRAFDDAVVIREYDCGEDGPEMRNYKRLVAYENRFGSKENEMLKLFIGDRHYLAGVKQMVEKALPVVREALAAREAVTDAKR